MQLERDGHRVTEAVDGRQALEELHRYRPDLLLLDLSMPDMDGWDLLAALREDPSLDGMPIAILTADPQESVELRAKEAGADAFLVKPLRASDHMAVVQRLLVK
jgi:two-component system chemotaxis response regulator CheY